MKATPLYLVWMPFLLLTVLFSCTEKEALTDDAPTFKKTYIDTHDGYSEAVVVVFDGLKTIRVSGQVGEGPDLDSQMRSALSNLNEVLGKAGASMDDVVKMNTYIVDYGPESLQTFRGVRKELLGDSDMPASTLVGVASLALPEWLIEIEAVAVMPITE